MRRLVLPGWLLIVTVLAISARSQINAAPGSEDALVFSNDDAEIPDQVTVSSVEVSGCCFPMTRFPRNCSCVSTQACVDALPESRNDCEVCAAGHGTYATMEECMDAGEIGEEAIITDTAPFPEPLIAATSCSASATDDSEVSSDTRTGCPHLQAGLSNWQDAATWGGALPNLANTVTLPANKKVRLSACSLPPGASIKQIIVPFGSELILDDTEMAITLGSIIVRGALRAGSPTCRLNSQITLTFKPYAGIDPIYMGITTAPSGTLDIFGKLYTPTWTRLAATASVGASSIVLQDAVNWVPGQLIVVITSTFKDEVKPNQNEVRTIKSVGGGGKTITLDARLSFQHFGGGVYQSEVALLSRNIIIQGSSETESTRKGPHIRMESKSRISGVMAFRAGQLNVLGAYPFHFHMIGDGTGSYLTDNSVYRSFFRCYTIHGTDNSVVKNNVAFDVQGHCFYVEDGIEENNTIEGNFAGYVHPIGTPAGGSGQDGMTFESSPNLIQPADAGAAGFYISNPNNNIINNAASGGVSGFTIPVLPKPTGMSRNKNIVPSARPWGIFKGNTVHSSGYFSLQTGGCFYFGGRLIEQPLSNYEFKFVYNSGRWSFPTMDKDGIKKSTPVVQDNKAWLCNNGMLFWGERLDVNGWETHDSIRSLFLLSRSVVNRLYATGSTGNTGPANFPGNRAEFLPQAAIQLYDTGTQTIITNSRFQNWKYIPSLGELRPSVFYSMTHSDQFKPQSMFTMSKITYIDVDYNAIARLDVKETGSSRMFNWVDTDGTSVQRPGPHIVGAWPRWWEIASNCFFQEAWKTWVCPSKPDQTVARIDLRIPGYTIERDNAVPPTPQNYIGTISQFGERREMTITKNEGITGVTGSTGWFPSFPNGSPKTMELWMTQVPLGRYILFAAKYPPGTTFNIQRIFKWYGGLSGAVTQVNTLNAVLTGSGTNYFFDGNYLYIKLMDPQVQEGNLVRDGLTVYGIRWWDMHYSIVATNRASGFTQLSGCINCPPPKVVMPAAVADVVEVGPPSAQIAACTDVAPTGDGSAACAAFYAEGECHTPYAVASNACALTCGRCNRLLDSPARSTSVPNIVGSEGGGRRLRVV